jgi:pimeloyl-ACP methyl ester carboxylesterase
MTHSRDKLKIAAGATTIGVAGITLILAALNKIVDQSAPSMQAPLGHETQSFAWTEGDVSYTVAGKGPAVILLHGIYAGASSFEFSRIFAGLAEKFRVYAPDLPGFGLSSRERRTYTPELYIDFIQDFTRQVAGGADNPVYLIASSLTCAFAIEAAADRSDLFERIVLIEPAGLQELSERPNIGQQILGGLLRTPLIGTSLYNLLVSRAGLRYYLAQQVYLHADRVTDDLVDRYYSISHQSNARYAAASFIGGDLNLDIADVFPLLPMPILICWGRKARFAPLEQANDFLERNAQSELCIFERSSGLPHDEESPEFIRTIGAWLRSNISSRS